MRTCSIYALCEPGTRTVRYIGKTNDFKRRRKEHRRPGACTKTHLGYWLKLLEKRGEKPSVILLREVTEAEGSAAEIKYIRIARESLGMDLVNGTDGGEGGPLSAEIREKMRVAHIGKPWSPARRLARQTKRGPRTAEQKMAHSLKMRGRKLSIEHKEKISQAGRGRVTSAETRAKLSAANMGHRVSRETCEKIGAASGAARLGKKWGPYRKKK